MRNLLRCRRGSVAFATVVALVPLLGALALGAEAGSWYVIKQHAQNAADSAAMSGGLAIANSNSQPDFGTLNGFPSKVTMTQGSYSKASGFLAGGIPVNGVSTAAVQAEVTQCEPQKLTSLFYTASCNGKNRNQTIYARAIASVLTPAKLPCAFALNGPITFHDNGVAVNAPNCTMASNVPAPPASQIGIDLSHTPSPFAIGGLSTSGSCIGSACSSVSPPVITYAPPVINPFSALTSALTSPSILTLPACSGALTPYTASTPCANDNQTMNSATSITVSGVYFFSGGLSLGGNGSLTTAAGVSATIIVLPVYDKKGVQQQSLKMAGGSSFNITAPLTAPLASALPGQLASVANLLADMAIFDPETSPQITGGATMRGSGVFYLPNANPLNFQGNSTSASSTCTEVIAASIEFSGSSNYLDNSGCPSSIVPKSQRVVLVQ